MPEIQESGHQNAEKNQPTWINYQKYPLKEKRKRIAYDWFSKYQTFKQVKCIA